MVHKKLRPNRLGQLNDNLGEKQNVRNDLWVLVDKPYYCDPVRHKFDTCSVDRGSETRYESDYERNEMWSHCIVDVKDDAYNSNCNLCF